MWRMASQRDALPDDDQQTKKERIEMKTVSKNLRAAARAFLESSSQWDASTMVIRRNGDICARRDADKTQQGSDAMLYLVANINAI